MNISLSQIRIASPCTVSWNSMTGDDRARFCGQCKLNVYNISVMSQGEAERLIAEKEGRVCLRLYKRTDGTLITRDCPVGLAAIRRKAGWMIGKAAAGVVLLVSGFAWAVDYANPYRERTALRSAQPMEALMRWLHEPAPVQVTMGVMIPMYSPPRQVQVEPVTVPAP